MSDLFATCSRCHHSFPLTNFIGGSGSVNIVMENSTSNCPRCGGIANIRDGFYEYRNGISTYLAENAKDAETVRALRMRLESITQWSSESAIREGIEAASPELGKQTQGMSLDRLIAVIGLIITILAYIQPLLEKTPETSFSPDQFRQLIEAIEGKD